MEAQDKQPSRSSPHDNAGNTQGKRDRKQTARYNPPDPQESSMHQRRGEEGRRGRPRSVNAHSINSVVVDFDPLASAVISRDDATQLACGILKEDDKNQSAGRMRAMTANAMLKDLSCGLPQSALSSLAELRDIFKLGVQSFPRAPSSVSAKQKALKQSNAPQSGAAQQASKRGRPRMLREGVKAEIVGLVNNPAFNGMIVTVSRMEDGRFYVMDENEQIYAVDKRNLKCIKVSMGLADGMQGGGSSKGRGRRSKDKMEEEQDDEEEDEGCDTSAAQDADVSYEDNAAGTYVEQREDDSSFSRTELRAPSHVLGTMSASGCALGTMSGVTVCVAPEIGTLETLSPVRNAQLQAQTLPWVSGGVGYKDQSGHGDVGSCSEGAKGAARRLYIPGLRQEEGVHCQGTSYAGFLTNARCEYKLGLGPGIMGEVQERGRAGGTQFMGAPASQIEGSMGSGEEEPKLNHTVLGGGSQQSDGAQPSSSSTGSRASKFVEHNDAVLVSRAHNDAVLGSRARRKTGAFSSPGVSGHDVNLSQRESGGLMLKPDESRGDEEGSSTAPILRAQKRTRKVEDLDKHSSNENSSLVKDADSLSEGKTAVQPSRKVASVNEHRNLHIPAAYRHPCPVRGDEFDEIPPEQDVPSLSVEHH